jgi:hypothetical protein
MAKVKSIFTHAGIYGLKMAGDEYETSDLHAAELKRNGLVETDIKAADPEKTTKISTASAFGDTTTTAIQGDGPGMKTVNKKQLDEDVKKANKK